MRKCTILKIFIIVCLLLNLISCKSDKITEINIGYIGPLSGNAEDLGLPAARALALAVEQYNIKKSPDAPKINFFQEDDKWEKTNAIPLYDKLRKEHKIDILFISNSEGTVVLQDKILKDKVIIINPLNNDSLLSTMNKNTFKIGKNTEETARIVSARIIELGLKKVSIFNVDNYFMSLSAKALDQTLKKQYIETEIFPVDIKCTEYREQLSKCKTIKSDAIVWFGYKNLGFAMKQAREMGIKVPYLASNTLFGDGYYKNSEGTMNDTEFGFFTQSDGNYVLANEFSNTYRIKYGKVPVFFWSAMQAYDAFNILSLQLAQLSTKQADKPLDEWLREKLHTVSFYQGVCGNIAILADGSSKGIYFSLYKITGESMIVKVKR